MAAFAITRMVQFAETDMAGVMHFAIFFRMMEEVEHAFWRSEGMTVHTKDTDGESAVSWPRVAAQCDYKAAARFEDVLDISIRVSRIGGKSVQYEIEFKRGGELIAVGRMSAACCRVTHGGRFEAMTIPDDSKRVLESIAVN